MLGLAYLAETAQERPEELVTICVRFARLCRLQPDPSARLQGRPFEWRMHGGVGTHAASALLTPRRMQPRRNERRRADVCGRAAQGAESGVEALHRLASAAAAWYWRRDRAALEAWLHSVIWRRNAGSAARGDGWWRSKCRTVCARMARAKRPQHYGRSRPWRAALCGPLEAKGQLRRHARSDRRSRARSVCRCWP